MQKFLSPVRAINYLVRKNAFICLWHNFQGEMVERRIVEIRKWINIYSLNMKINHQIVL